MEIAAAPVRSSFSMSVRIHCDDTSVSPGTAPPIEHHGAELADRAGEGQAGAGQQRRQQRGQDHLAEDGDVVGAQRGGRLLDLAVEFQQHRLHRADHERQRDEQQRDTDAPLGVLQVKVHWAVRAVQRQHHQAGHDGRQRERQIDDRRRPAACRGSRRGSSTQAHQQAEEQVDHASRRREMVSVTRNDSTAPRWR